MVSITQTYLLVNVCPLSLLAIFFDFSAKLRQWYARLWQRLRIFQVLSHFNFHIPSYLLAAETGIPCFH